MSAPQTINCAPVSDPEGNRLYVPADQAGKLEATFANERFMDWLASLLARGLIESPAVTLLAASASLWYYAELTRWRQKQERQHRAVEKRRATIRHRKLQRWLVRGRRGVRRLSDAGVGECANVLDADGIPGQLLAA